jgi:hypothetical protein
MGNIHDTRGRRLPLDPSSTQPRRSFRATQNGFWLAFMSFWTAILLLLSTGAQATEIWLAGLPPTVFNPMHPGLQSDYMSLFEPKAPWPQAASVVRVLKIYSQFANRASDDELRTSFADLRRRHIALAMEGGLMTAGPACGRGVEGYGTTPESATRIAERIRKAGGELQYLAMDEPMSWGHQYGPSSSCHSSMADIARDVVANIAIYKRVFPDLQVGDIESLGRLTPAGWVDEIMQWTAAYRTAAGVPFAFLHVDIAWDGPWREQLPLLASRLRGTGIKFGIIYDGGIQDQTSLAWTQRAEQRFVEIESGLRVIPDQAIIQTFFPQPLHMLPETQPGTMTWLVDRYAASPTRLVLHRSGGRLDGTATDEAGRPLADVPVTLTAEVFGTPDAPALHTYSNLVPPRATEALLVLRANTECNCSGPADIGIGPMRFRDDRTGQVVQRAFGPETALTRYQIQPGQPISKNTSHFPVTAGDPFTLQVPMRTNAESAGSGFVALIFVDAQGREFMRLPLPFGPASDTIGTVTTDAQGRFSLQPSTNVMQRATGGFRAEFSGTPGHRITEAHAR